MCMCVCKCAPTLSNLIGGKPSPKNLRCYACEDRPPASHPASHCFSKRYDLYVHNYMRKQIHSYMHISKC